MHPHRSPSVRSFQLIVFICAMLPLVGCATLRPIEAANRDRVVVVTGASSGFGKGVALRLADQGARLVLAARRAEALEDVARECRARGATALAMTTDVSRDRDVAALARTAVEQFGRIDVWINVAGIGAVGRFEDVPLEDHRRVIDVNLTGVINGSYHAMRQFRLQQAGTLINIASMAGRVSMPYYASYSASKHGVVGLGASLNQELRMTGPRNIRVSTILPYASDTPWFQHAANYSGHQLGMILMDPPEKIIDAIVRATVAPRPEVPVGWKAKAIATSHRIGRRLTENIGGRITHNVITDGAPTPTTSGNLHEPMREGTGIRRDR